jgi:hypothetical protein
MKLWTSMGPEEDKEVKHLQELFDKNLSKEYDETLKKYGEKSQFRLTDGKVFKIIDQGKKMNVRIMLQVMGGTINWYFVSPKDETHQSERDELYGAAALGHLEVENHCEKYWRGTNSLHVKKMHTMEKEAGWNHNHYRLGDDKLVDAKDLEQHLMGVVHAQNQMGLVSNGVEKFLTEKEAGEILHKFKVHLAKVNHVGQATVVKIDNEEVTLNERKISKLEEFNSQEDRILTEEDKMEWEEHQHEENPCKSIDPNLQLKEKFVAIQKGMRGLGAELASTRQMANSANATIKTVVAKNDKKIEEFDVGSSRQV